MATIRVRFQTYRRSPLASHSALHEPPFKLSHWSGDQWFFAAFASCKYADETKEHQNRTNSNEHFDR
jgi:hypothetical protein